jgi:hypothetical protein
VVIIKVLTTLLGFTSYSITLIIATYINHIGYHQAISFTITMMKITDMVETCYHYYCDNATSTI